MICRGLLQNACRMGVQKTALGRTLAPRVATSALRFFGGHGDPRAHLNPDGTRPEAEDAEDYHDPDPIDHQPKPAGELWEDIPQVNVPYWHRSRLLIWGNYKLLMKAEYLFFYIPTVLIFGLVIPLFTTIYALEEVVGSTMTVKVIGRQWYWVYEVES